MDAARIETIARSLSEVRLLVLFGSRATGRERPGSDTDLAVSLEPDTVEVRRRVDAAPRQAVPGEVDVVFTAGAPPLLRLEIARAGRLIFEREPGSWAHFKARAMLDWGDWAPHARFLAEAAVRRNRERLRDGQA